jgi:hypothetical protein
MAMQDHPTPAGAMADHAAPLLQTEVMVKKNRPMFFA